MNSTSFVYPLSSQPYQPYAAAKAPVSEESTNMKDSSMKPIEQAAHTDRAANKMDKSDDQRQEEQKSLQARRESIEQQAIDQQIIKKLSTLDREVRNHERAHAAVGGKYAGAPSYQYERGPDGINYAVAGEVSISTSPVAGNPELTIEKAQIVRRAALAPADPSPQDMKVAMEALQLEAEARIELSLERQAERTEEQKSQEDRQQMKTENQATEGSTEADGLAVAGTSADDPVDTLNQAQEDVFNEINKDLAAQLVSLGGAQLSPRSLGSIVNRQI